jgi:two-component system, NarL family, response regulator NreC
MTVSIVVADDHTVVRRGLRAILQAEPDFSIIGEACDGLETVRLIERTKPDVLVLDLMMPGLSGLEVLRILRERVPDTHVVVLSMQSNKAFVAEALKIGATGYVLKGCTEVNLIRAVRDAATGTRFLSPPVNAIAIDAYIEQAKAGPFDVHESLTAREREVLQLAAEGKTSSEIAARLHISHRTVDNHRSRLLQKLGLQNQTELVRYALERGMLPSQTP